MEGISYKFSVGSIMYAMVSTCPDIAHVVGVVSRFMSNLGKTHWEAIKWILRYLKGTLDLVLFFGSNNIQLQGFMDLDLARDLDKCESNTSYRFMFTRVAISWASRMQHSITLSPSEVKYLALFDGAQEMIWLQ